MNLRRSHAFRVGVIFLFGSALLLNLFAFSLPRVFADGPDCALHFTPYHPPEVFLTTPPDQTIDLHWASCATYDEQGPFTFEIWIAPINQLRLMQAWPDQAPNRTLYSIEK